MENMEVENKYSAKDIKRKDFEVLAESLKPKKSIVLNKEESVDYYFTKKNRFMRFRNSCGKWELTTKLKLNDNNNRVRMETNLTLGKDTSREKAISFANGCGFQPDFTIRKDGVVYWYDKIVLSYYTCFTEEGKELDTFLEIECNESYKWASEEDALAELLVWEKNLGELGLTPQKRVRKSLFEFYTKIGE